MKLTDLKHPFAWGLLAVVAVAAVPTVASAEFPDFIRNFPGSVNLTPPGGDAGSGAGSSFFDTIRRPGIGDLLTSDRVGGSGGARGDGSSFLDMPGIRDIITPDRVGGSGGDRGDGPILTGDGVVESRPSDGVIVSPLPGTDDPAPPAGGGGGSGVGSGGPTIVFPGIGDIVPLPDYDHYPGPACPPGGNPPGHVPANPIPSNPLPASNPGVATSVVFVNPADTGAPVRYVLGGRARTLNAGFSESLSLGRPATVEFDRGGSFGRARYRIREGTYTFAITARGWELFRKTYRVTVDNTGNAGPFQYVVDGQSTLVPAGLSQLHTSRHPIVIAFDRGNGQAARKTLDSGVYEVAINPQTGLWALVPVGAAAVSSVASAAPVDDPPAQPR